jgi:hypothetical protein
MKNKNCIFAIFLKLSEYCHEIIIYNYNTTSSPNYVGYFSNCSRNILSIVLGNESTSASARVRFPNTIELVKSV